MVPVAWFLGDLPLGICLQGLLAYCISYDAHSLWPRLTYFNSHLIYARLFLKQHFSISIKYRRLLLVKVVHIPVGLLNATSQLSTFYCIMTHTSFVLHISFKPIVTILFVQRDSYKTRVILLRCCDMSARSSVFDNKHKGIGSSLPAYVLRDMSCSICDNLMTWSLSHVRTASTSRERIYPFTSEGFSFRARSFLQKRASIS